MADDAPKMMLVPGHNIFLLAVTMNAGASLEEVTERVVSWFEAALDADAIGPSDTNEFQIGPATTTVIPTTETVSQRLARFCGNPAAVRDMEIAPVQPVSSGEVLFPATLHIDWRGQTVELPAEWTDTGLLSTRWIPTRGDFFERQVELAAIAQCSMEDELVREPVEEPPLLDLPELPDAGVIGAEVGKAARTIAFIAGGVALAGAFYWLSTRKGGA